MLATLPLVAGCPTEVPYQTDQEPPEAPASDPGVAAEEAAQDSDEPTASTAPSGETSPPAVGDRYATAPGQAPARMPWETDAPNGEATPEAERLFADAAEPAEPAPEAETPAESSSEGGGFADFLDDAYAGMLDEKATETPEEPAEPQAQPEVAAAPAADVGSRYDANDLFAESQPAIDLPPAASVEPAKKPEPPAASEPSDSDLLSELWGDEDQTTEPEPEPASKPEPPAPAPSDPIVRDDKLPFGLDETPPTEPEPTTQEAPPLFAEEPEPEPEPPIEPLPEPKQVEPELFSTAPEPTPSFEPKPVVDPPESRAPPMASSAIDPLPAVPVLPFNTRHLAWLLGAKYGLAELADLDGATPDEVAEWSSEVERLAEELRIGAPSSSRQAVDPAERVGRMMRSAARTGEALATEHGVDHAALLEISLKTNALLVVAEKRPDLAGPVARAVRDAADRALLPRFLWDQSVRVLESEPTPEEALDAVTRLHERVESFLR